MYSHLVAVFRSGDWTELYKRLNREKVEQAALKLTQPGKLEQMVRYSPKHQKENDPVVALLVTDDGGAVVFSVIVRSAVVVRRVGTCLQRG